MKTAIRSTPREDVNPARSRPERTLMVRLLHLSHVSESPADTYAGIPCRLWDGSQVNGYGKVSIGRARLTWAHRAAYMVWRGEIPRGHDVHHLCGNRLCIEPSHLEPRPHVTHGPEHMQAWAAITAEKVGAG
jgi:hypothetical protein